MTRAPFIVIDGRLYRWKDILELRRAQLAAAGAAQASQLALFATLHDDRRPPAERTEGLIEEIPARGALPIWRRDEENGAVALRITRRGLAAIRIDEHRAFLETQEPAAPGKGRVGHT